MPIGEFGRPPSLPEDVGAPVVSPMYWMYEMGQASLSPARAFADATKLMFQSPLNPLTSTEIGLERRRISLLASANSRFADMRSVCASRSASAAVSRADLAAE